MPLTYEPIATATLGSATATISFTSIPSIYTDLAISVYANATASNHLYARWGNGSYDSGTNYSNTGMYTRTTTNDYGSERNNNFAFAMVDLFRWSL
jgi:hypothetical protein